MSREVLGMVQRVIRQNAVAVFQSPNCPFCRRALAKLDELDVVYKSVEVDGAIKGALHELTGRTSVPAVFVGGQWVGGCNDGGLGGVLPLAEAGRLLALVKEANSKLDNKANL